MKTILALLLLATSALAETPTRETFPSDYTPQPCAADTAAVCQSFPRSRLASYGTTFRGYDIHYEWIDAHWDEMVKVFSPMCAKIANCFTVKDNDWVYCVDLLRDEFVSGCDRFPAGSKDRDQCTMFAVTYYVGLGPKSKLHQESQECVAKQPPPTKERTLTAWITPDNFDMDFDGEVKVYAYDSETHIPVRARITTDSETPFRSTEGPNPTAGYASKWRAGLKRLPNTTGRREFATPTVTLQATGYTPLTLPIPIAVPKMKIEVAPSLKSLKPGIHTITVTTRDAATGKTVPARVMAGEVPLGSSNKPLTLEVKKGEKLPEIWVTSFYERYGDQVVQ
jgi:hypothetical protein